MRAFMFWAAWGNVALHTCPQHKQMDLEAIVEKRPIPIRGRRDKRSVRGVSRRLYLPGVIGT
jgi:hypothetical protein